MQLLESQLSTTNLLSSSKHSSLEIVRAEKLRLESLNKTKDIQINLLVNRIETLEQVRDYFHNFFDIMFSIYNYIHMYYIVRLDYFKYIL